MNDKNLHVVETFAIFPRRAKPISEDNVIRPPLPGNAADPHYLFADLDPNLDPA
jgi:hypothetical protein